MHFFLNSSMDQSRNHSAPGATKVLRRGSAAFDLVGSIVVVAIAAFMLWKLASGVIVKFQVVTDLLIGWPY